MIKRNMTTLRKLMLLNGAIGGILSEDTAIGNPLTFVTDLARSLKSLLIPFTPVQSGTGDPSPQNIRSILPWNGLTVFGGGKNVLSGTVKNLKNLSSNNGTFVNTATDTRSNAQIRIEAYNGNTYLGQFANKITTKPRVISAVLDTTSYPTMNRLMITHYGSSKDFEALFEWALPKGKYTLQFNLTGADVQTVGGFSFDSVMVEAGEVTPSQYEAPHITETDISFPSPVYGGTLDVVSGVLTVDKAYQLLNDADKWTQLTAGQTVDFSYEQDFERKLYDGSLTGLNCSAFLAVVNQNVAFCRWRGATSLKFGIKNGSSMATPLTLEDVKQMATNGEIAICYDIEPQTVQLTGEQITALVGDNTIWSDADRSMTATYLKKG